MNAHTTIDPLRPIAPVAVMAREPDDRLWQAIRDERNGVPGASERVDAAIRRLRAEAGEDAE